MPYEPDRVRGPSPAAAAHVWKLRERRAHDRAARLASAEERERRRNSRTAHRGLSHSEAGALARRVFPEVADRRGWRPLEPLAGEDAVRYLDRFSARVKSDDAAVRGIVESTTPLRVEDAAGDLAPVDLALIESADGLRPKNGYVRMDLDPNAQRGVTLPDIGVRVGLANAAPSAQSVVGGAAFYGNVAADTDFMIRPAADGFSTYVQARSPESPESFDLAFGLPDGADLRRSATGSGYEIVGNRGLVAHLSEAAAWDADGTPIEVSTELVGSALRLNVSHAERDVRYPLLIDPHMSVDYRWRVDGSTQWAGWKNWANHPGFWFRDPTTPWAEWGRGLFTFQRPTAEQPSSNYDYNWHEGEWYIGAPGTSYIYAAQTHYAANDYYSSCQYEGIYSSAGGGRWSRQTRWDYVNGVFQGSIYYPSRYYQQQYESMAPYWDCADEDPRFTNESRYWCLGDHRCGHPDDADPPANDPREVEGSFFIFGTQIPPSRTSNFTTYLGGATLHIADRDDPVISLVSKPEGWTNDPNAEIVVSATDEGLGPRHLKLNPDEPWTYDSGWVCLGTHWDPCDEPLERGRQLDGLGDGIREVRAWAADPAGRQGSQQPSGADATWTVKLDRQAPDVTPSGSLWERRNEWQDDGPAELSVATVDGVRGGTNAEQRSGVDRIEVLVDGAPLAPVDPPPAPCDGDSCPLTRQFAYDPPDYRKHTVKVLTYDRVGNPPKVVEWDTLPRPDDLPPELTVSGGLRNPVATGRDLNMEGRDADSGVTSLEVWLDPDADPSADEAVDRHEPDCSAGCPETAEDSWSLPVDTPQGEHELLVRATDGVGRTTEERWKFHYVDVLPAERSKLGLEQWFHYDETDAGGGSSVYVNADTGNAVWHTVPIVNPGLGLSTVVNLTYNSQDRGGLFGSKLGGVPLVDAREHNLPSDLPGLSYGEAGVGFSLGISGPTRLNEPLGGVIPAAAVEEASELPADYGTPELPTTSVGMEITLTDSDGTVHTFTRTGEGWEAPPGLNMRLRRFSEGGTLLNPVRRKWALTRPDGVTHFFDNLGYLTETEDRNGNTLEYHYEVYNAFDGLTGDTTATACANRRLGELVDVGAAPVLCAKRIREVEDASLANHDNDPETPEQGRKLTIEYEAGGLLEDTPNYRSLPARLWYESAGVVGGKAGRIKKITDHASRDYTFEYDDDGYLTTFTEAANRPGARITRFEYESGGTFATLGQNRQLTAVVEGTAATGDEERATSIRYVDPADRPLLDIVSPPGGIASLVARPREVCGITRRAENPGPLTPAAGEQDDDACKMRASEIEKTYDYDLADQEAGTPQQFTVEEVLRRRVGTTPARTADTVVELDGRSRPTSITDPLGRETTIGWSNPVNGVTRLTRAAGNTSEAAQTEFDYDETNGTGVLTQKREYPNWPSTTPVRTTTLTYRSGPGIHQSGVLAEGGGSIDGAGQFVADLVSVTKPKPGTGASFEVDSRGNVTHSYKLPNQAGAAARTTYDARGRVTSEISEMNEQTSYPTFNRGGEPTTVTDPRGNQWTYVYDELENVTAVVDPRATDKTGTAGNPYTTTLGYDAFDRLTNEQIPKLSNPADGGQAQGRFRTRARTYDRNGNLTSETDGNTKTTTIDYTASGQPEQTTTPGDAGSEVTRYVYDDADRLIARVDPKGASVADPAAIRSAQEDACEGAAQPAALAFTTRYCLDAAGRRIAEVRTSTSTDDPAALITAFAYDDRDNLVGTVDAKRNADADATVAEAVTAAGNSNLAITTRRSSFRYDKLDRLTDRLEHPTETEGDPPTRVDALRTHFDYDENGNRTTVLPPRAYEAAGPEGAPDVSFGTTTYYDNRDQVVAQRDYAGCTRLDRRADGRVAAVTSPRGTTAVTSGDCSTGAQPSHYTTRYTYDAAGDLIARTIPYAPDQYGRNDAEFANWQVTYWRDEVGNAEWICDPRTNASTDPCVPSGTEAQNDQGFHNTYYDSGELRSTERPSWYGLQWNPGRHEPRVAGDRYAEGDPNVDFEIGDGGPQLREVDDRSRNAERSDQDPEKPTSAGAGKFASVERNDLGSLIPDAGDTTFAYDGEMQLATITDAASKARTIGYDPQGRVTSKQWPDAGGPIKHLYDYDLNGNLTKYTNGRGDDTDFGYDGYDRLVSETAPGSLDGPADTSETDQVTNFDYDENGNVIARETPRGALTSANTTDLRFTFTYDSVDRLLTETNPVDATWEYGYDPDGNRAFERSPRFETPEDYAAADFQTDFVYDEAGRLETVTAGFGDDKVTSYTYDPDGNLASTAMPGSAAQNGGVSARREQATVYDGRGLPWKETTGPVDGTAGRRTTLREYDANGNLRRVVNPSGVAANGDPHQQDLTANPGSDPEFDAGEARDDATWHATLREYDEHDQIEQVALPWSNAAAEGEATVANPDDPDDPEAGGDERRLVQEFRRDATFGDQDETPNPLKRITSIVSPHEEGASSAPRTSYTYFDNGWTHTQSEEKVMAADTGQPVQERLMTFAYDAEGHQTLWRTRNAGTDYRGRKIKRQFYPDGTLEQRIALKPQRGPETADDDTADPELDVAARCYRYYYNSNRSLTQIDDFDTEITDADQASKQCGDTTAAKAGRARTTVIGRDAAERETVVDEQWTNGRDTQYSEYDANGNVQQLSTDGSFNATNGSYTGDETKATTFEYDPLDRETEATVTARGETRKTATDWWDSGEISTRTKANGTVEQRFFNAHGEISQKRRDPAATAADTEVQGYDYDADGNRIMDERGGHIGQDGEVEDGHVFNARGQLVEWTRGAKYTAVDPSEDKEGTTVTYERNASGDITTKVDSFDPSLAALPTTTTYNYAGERLRSSEATRGPATVHSTYYHDDFGSVTRIVSDQQGPVAPPPDPQDGAPSGDVCEEEVPDEAEADVTRYCFDEFERMTLARGQGVDEPTNFVYDGLDRRDRRTTDTNDDGTLERRDYSYVGTSTLLARETDSGGKVKTYDYDSQGRRLGQSVDDDGVGGTAPVEHRAFAVDSNGSVEALEGDEGIVGDDTYLYDPYGENEKLGEDAEGDDAGLSAAARENPFRFEGFYYDASVKTYDMHARQYRPDTGRFLSQDRYESAVGDQLLQADPLTQNRYAFAGGNPVNNVEFDGHRPAPVVTGAPSRSPHGGRGSRRYNQAAAPIAEQHRRGFVSGSQRYAAAPVSSYSDGSLQKTVALDFRPPPAPSSPNVFQRVTSAAARPFVFAANNAAAGAEAAGKGIASGAVAIYNWQQGQMYGSDGVPGVGDPLSLGEAAEQVSMIVPPLRGIRLGVTAAPKIASALEWTFRGLRGGAAKATTEVAEEVATRQVTVLGRYIGGTERYIGEPGFNVLNVPGKGAGRWNWTRNKRFIDDAIERGDEIRLVTNPYKPLYSGGNTYQRELKYLNQRGYGRFEPSGDYWIAGPGR